MRLALLLASLLVTAVTLAQPATQPTVTYSDADETFSMQATEPWAHNDRMLGSTGTIHLAISYGEGEGGGMAPSILVMVPPERSPATLDAVAQSLVQNAKKNQPDQGSLPPVRRITLGGDEARQVSFLLKREAQVVFTQATIARHRNRLYVVELVCPEDQRTRAVPLANRVLATFKWKK